MIIYKNNARSNADFHVVHAIDLSAGFSSSAFSETILECLSVNEYRSQCSR